jgi:hypothetical protein
MELAEYYATKSDEELIEILETKYDYSEEAIEIVLAEFTKRKVAPELVIVTAKRIYSEVVGKIVADNGLTDIEHDLPPSHFLTQQQMLKIYKTQLQYRKALLQTTHDGAKRFRKGGGSD